jgi:kynurenine 3-monooxygenase
MTATITTSKKAIVVGAGPVGCLTALALAKRGWVVDLFEARPGSLPCPI